MFSEKFLQEKSVIFESIVWISAIILLISLLSSMLITAETTFTHDNFYWYYPIFQFFAENIANGQFPLWNPFTHGGEPFYPILPQFRLFEPLVILNISLGQLVTDDIVLLFNWNRFIQSLVMLFGVYIVFRLFAKHLLIRLTLIPILLYSSLLLGSFHQDAILNQFLWVPYITFFLLQIVYYKDYRWHNWLLLSVLIGINWQSYFFSGILTFLLFFTVGLIIFHRNLLKQLFSSPRIGVKLLISCAIILSMMGPNLVYLLEKDNYVYPARMVDLSRMQEGHPTGGPLQHEGGPENVVSGGIVMPYEHIAHYGTFSTTWDFIQIISPSANPYIKRENSQKWGTSSEAYMYIGVIPWFIALFGMIMGSHPLKKVWLIIMIGFGLLMLGPVGKLHLLLYHVYPPLWFVRHTHAFVLFFMFSVIYFYILGCNKIYTIVTEQAFQKKSITSITIKIITIIIVTILSYIYMMTILRYPSINYQYLLISLLILFIWLVRKTLNKEGIFISLVLIHIVAVSILSPYPVFPDFVAKTLIVIVLLLFLLSLIPAHFPLLKRYAGLLVYCTFLVAITGDLLNDFKQSHILYENTYRPDFNQPSVNTKFQSPVLPETRLSSPQAIKMICQQPCNSQGMRYSSVVYRFPYVFSAKMNVPGWNTYFNKTGLYQFKNAKKAKRWNSFLLPNLYFKLIHSPIYIEAMKNMFAVNKPIFQFKSHLVPLSDKELLTYLAKPETEKTLNDHVFVQYPHQLPDMEKGIEKTLSEANFTSPDSTNQSTFTYNLKNYTYNSFELLTKTNKPGVLYWADGYNKHWQAYINGEKTPILRSNINFKSIILPSGKNNIKFTYEPKLFLISVYVFYTTIFVVLLLAGWVQRY
jgi:hypothetical protein